MAHRRVSDDWYASNLAPARSFRLSVSRDPMGAHIRTRMLVSSWKTLGCCIEAWQLQRSLLCIMILIQFSKPLGWGRRKGKKTFRLAETERIARPLTHRVPLHLMPFFKNSLASSNLGGNCSLLKSAKSFYHDEVFAHAFLKASSYATNAKWSARGRHYGTTSPFKTPRKPGFVWPPSLMSSQLNKRSWNLTPATIPPPPSWRQRRPSSRNLFTGLTCGYIWTYILHLTYCHRVVANTRDGTIIKKAVSIIIAHIKL